MQVNVLPALASALTKLKMYAKLTKKYIQGKQRKTFIVDDIRYI